MEGRDGAVAARWAPAARVTAPHAAMKGRDGAVAARALPDPKSHGLRSASTWARFPVPRASSANIGAGWAWTRNRGRRSKIMKTWAAPFASPLTFFTYKTANPLLGKNQSSPVSLIHLLLTTSRKSETSLSSMRESEL